VFAPIPRRLLLPVVRESLEWHLRRDGVREDDAVLNACRALRYVRADAWASKGAAGEWALGKVADGELVSAALARRDRSAKLGRKRVERFIRGVLSEAAAADDDAAKGDSAALMGSSRPRSVSKSGLPRNGAPSALVEPDQPVRDGQ
jgi:Aminoglycoside adenylyltransferase, C-terminal domain